MNALKPLFTNQFNGDRRSGEAVAALTFMGRRRRNNIFASMALLLLSIYITAFHSGLIGMIFMIVTAIVNWSFLIRFYHAVTKFSHQTATAEFYENDFTYKVGVSCKRIAYNNLKEASFYGNTIVLAMDSNPIVLGRNNFDGINEAEFSAFLNSKNHEMFVQHGAVKLGKVYRIMWIRSVLLTVVIIGLVVLLLMPTSKAENVTVPQNVWQEFREMCNIISPNQENRQIVAVFSREDIVVAYSYGEQDELIYCYALKDLNDWKVDNLLNCTHYSVETKNNHKITAYRIGDYYLYIIDVGDKYLVSDAINSVIGRVRTKNGNGVASCLVLVESMPDDYVLWVDGAAYSKAELIQ